MSALNIELLFLNLLISALKTVHNNFFFNSNEQIIIYNNKYKKI